MTRRACLLLLVLSVTHADATIVLVDEERFVSTSVFLEVDPENIEDSDRREPMGFDPFAEAILSMVELDALESQAVAEQTSTLSDTGVDTQGRATTGLDGSFDLERTGFAISESSTDFTFLVEEPSTFSIAGTLSGAGQGIAQVQFTGPSSLVYTNVALFETFEFSHSGDLVPGEYRLIIRASAETRAGEVPRGLEDAAASYAATLIVTETTPIETTPWSMLKDRFLE